jgi:hypothetical protein
MEDMTKRKHRLLLLSLPALVALTVGAWLLWPRSAITRENAEKIQSGMTPAEVEAILGGPPRDESRGGWPIYMHGDLPATAWFNLSAFLGSKVPAVAQRRPAPSAAAQTRRPTACGMVAIEPGPAA